MFGKYEGNVDANENEIVIDGNAAKVFSIKDPSELPWKDLDIDFAVESTGKFSNAKEAMKHMGAGAAKVIISAPDATRLMGINDSTYDNDKHNIVSMASRTTNCLAPVLKTINDKFGIESGYMTTCHAYTNDQRILDDHSKILEQRERQ
jgi:glyceraldehyde 3-phosphate dehydrogenase